MFTPFRIKEIGFQSESRNIKNTLTMMGVGRVHIS